VLSLFARWRFLHIFVLFAFQIRYIAGIIVQNIFDEKKEDLMSEVNTRFRKSDGSMKILKRELRSVSCNMICI